jgi:DNA invertase Pin-like site-specific DNA recombinase
VTDRPLITYIRVSTSQQGRSGLGIEAQRQTLSLFALAEGFTATREFVEVETGKGSDALDRRPQKAQKAGATTLRQIADALNAEGIAVGSGMRSPSPTSWNGLEAI